MLREVEPTLASSDLLKLLLGEFAELEQQRAWLPAGRVLILVH
jgi:hypothetical protein